MNRFFAVIIFTGVAIAFTAAGVAWLTTTYHSMLWKPEVLRIYRVEIYENEHGVWRLSIEMVNEGDIVAEIYKIEIHGVEEIHLNPPKRIEPGKQGLIDIDLSRNYSYGTTYTVRLYLKSGTLYPILERIVRT